MASQTPNLNLYKVNPETDGEMTFNVKTMLNENWDRLDESIGEVHQEITTHRADYVRHPGYAVTAGTGNAYTVTTDPAPTAYVDGMGIVIRANRANTGAATLNWNGLGAMPIVDAKGNALIVGKIPNGARLSLRYSSAAGNFQLQGEGGEYGTATPADVLAGKTIGTEGGLVTGTMQDRGNVTATLTNQGQQYTIPVGKHGGSGIITANITNLNAANIKSGVSVGGVAGAFTSDATATAAQILTGQTAYTSGTKLTGTMPNRGAVSNTITTQGGQYTIPAGYHSGNGKVTASFANLTPENVKQGVNIGGVVGTLEVAKRAEGYLRNRITGDSIEVSGVSGFDFLPKIIMLMQLSSVDGAPQYDSAIYYCYYFLPYEYMRFSVNGKHRYSIKYNEGSDWGDRIEYGVFKFRGIPSAADRADYRWIAIG